MPVTSATGLDQPDAAAAAVARNDGWDLNRRSLCGSFLRRPRTIIVPQALALPNKAMNPTASFSD